MRKMVVCLMTAALFVSGGAAACGGSEYPVISTTKDDGTKIGLFISEAQIERTPAWKPEVAEPPLSVSAAYRAAKEWGREHYTRYDGVNVRELSLQTYSCSLVTDRWYYVVDLNPVIDGNELWSGGSWAAVLMDGTVIGPREY